MSYAEREESARQEQLDWLSQIAEESRTQTELLRRSTRHTGLIYVVAIIAVVLAGIWLLARLFELTS